MMEITLCVHNEIKSRCFFCCERACADCERYDMGAKMYQKPDGRVICPGCQKAIDAKSRERAQENLFVTQPALF